VTIAFKIPVRKNLFIYLFIYQNNLVFSCQTLYTFDSSPMRATWPAHLILLTWSAQWYLGMSKNHEASYCVTSSILLLLHPSYVQTISLEPCSQTLSSLNVPHQVSYPYKTTGRFFLYILTLHSQTTVTTHTAVDVSMKSVLYLVYSTADGYQQPHLRL
jgi:hypothetical protein